VAVLLVAAIAFSSSTGDALASRARLPAGPAGAELGRRQMTRDLHRVFAGARSHLITLSRLVSVRAQNWPECDAEMVARTDHRFTVIGAANLTGQIDCTSKPLTSAASIADRPYFRRGMDTRGYAVGDFQLGRVAGDESLGMGFPVHGFDGAINGLVFSSMSVNWLDRRVGAKRPGGALDVLVVDEHGTVLARAGRRQTPLGRNLAAKSLVQEMLAKDRGTGTFRFAGRRVTGAFGVVGPTGGAVHVAVSVRR
jgi:hypothetical protein